MPRWKSAAPLWRQFSWNPNQQVWERRVFALGETCVQIRSFQNMFGTLGKNVTRNPTSSERERNVNYRGNTRTGRWTPVQVKLEPFADNTICTKIFRDE